MTYTAADALYYAEEREVEEFEEALSEGVGIAQDFTDTYAVEVECIDWDAEDGFTFLISERTYVGPVKTFEVVGDRVDLQAYFNALEG